MKDAQFAELSVIGMKGCEAFAEQVDNYLQEWRRHTNEDTYLVDGYEHFGYMRGAYTKDELREMEQYAKMSFAKWSNMQRRAALSLSLASRR